MEQAKEKHLSGIAPCFPAAVSAGLFLLPVFRLDMLPSGSVSYTHLDVYKRQHPGFTFFRGMLRLFAQFFTGCVCLVRA